MRSLVFDIDGTISFCLDRDFENAKPNKPLIQKLNEFYDNGWQIILCTSRGQLSCGGNLEKRKAKYEKQIIHWMEKHGVKYHKLSFEKDFAEYYIDDKAMRPEEFINFDIEIVKGGWSGALVERRGDKIYKTHKRAVNEAFWYRNKPDYLKTPKIFSLDGDTIVMEFLEEVSKDPKRKHISILEYIKKFRNEPSLSKSRDYISKIATRVDDIKKKLGKDYSFIIHYFDNKEIELLFKQNTFCHGDLTTENTILTKTGLHFIDPIFEPDSWNHYILDITKLLYSLERDGLDITYQEAKNYCFENFEFSNIQYLFFEVVHWIRVYYYAPEEMKSKIEQKIEQKHELLRRIKP